MTKKVSALIMLILVMACLVSCNTGAVREPVQSSVLKPETYYTSFKISACFGRFIETPYGSYFASGSRYIYYSHKGNTKYVKLCNKPDCSHNSEDCNAFLKGSVIGYYDNKIYYRRFKHIYCMDMDGCNHKIVKALYEEHCSNHGYFHNGYYYYIKTNFAEYNGVKGKDDPTLYRTKVDDKSESEVLLTNDLILQTDMFTMIGDNIYISVRNSDPDKISSLYSYSTVTESLSKLTDDWSGLGSYLRDENKGYCYVKNKGFYEYDFGTNEMSLVKPIELENGGISGAFYLDDYILLVHNNSVPFDYENQVMCIYDRDYNLLNTIVFDKANGKIPGGFLSDVDGYIIFSSNFRDKPDYYIDKSEIGTDNLQFHKIED